MMCCLPRLVWRVVFIFPRYFCQSFVCSFSRKEVFSFVFRGICCFIDTSGNYIISFGIILSQRKDFIHFLNMSCFDELWPLITLNFGVFLLWSKLYFLVGWDMAGNAFKDCRMFVTDPTILYDCIESFIVYVVLFLFLNTF